MIDMLAKDVLQDFLRDLLYGIQFYTSNIGYYLQ